jgi:hemolysin activation/secretion protein
LGLVCDSAINDPLRISGYSDRNNFDIDRVLLKKSNLRISANTSLSTKESANYLNQQKIAVTERKLTIGNVGLAISSQFENGINLYLKPSYFKGLKLLNAKKDEPNLTADIPKAQFDYFKLYTSISKIFIIPKIEAPILLSTEMDSQYSKQTIYGTEQFSVGGYSSVRGFRENIINGDSGYLFRNKVAFNLGSLILPLTGNKINPGYLSYLNQLSMEPFYDYGHTRTKYNGNEGRLSGAGIKTIFGSKYFNASLTYSWAVNKSKLITSQEKENKMVYFEVSAGCC